MNEKLNLTLLTKQFTRDYWVQKFNETEGKRLYELTKVLIKRAKKNFNLVSGVKFTWPGDFKNPQLFWDFVDTFEMYLQIQKPDIETSDAILVVRFN